jgi:hypothetical protein
MDDEMRMMRGLRGYGIKEEFAHAKSATAAMGVENVSTFGPLRPSPTQAGILLRSWLENRSREGFGRMSK